METQERIEIIIDFAKKVLKYPKGSKDYDPIDAMRLANAIKKYEEETI